MGELVVRVPDPHDLITQQLHPCPILRPGGLIVLLVNLLQRAHDILNATAIGQKLLDASQDRASLAAVAEGDGEKRVLVCRKPLFRRLPHHAKWLAWTADNHDTNLVATARRPALPGLAHVCQ